MIAVIAAAIITSTSVKPRPERRPRSRGRSRRGRARVTACASCRPASRASCPAASCRRLRRAGVPGLAPARPRLPDAEAACAWAARFGGTSGESPRAPPGARGFSTTRCSVIVKLRGFPSFQDTVSRISRSGLLQLLAEGGELRLEHLPGEARRGAGGRRRAGLRSTGGAAAEQAGEELLGIAAPRELRDELVRREVRVRADELHAPLHVGAAGVREVPLVLLVEVLEAEVLVLLLELRELPAREQRRGREVARVRVVPQRPSRRGRRAP